MLKDLFKKARYVSVPVAQRVIYEMGEDRGDTVTCPKCGRKSDSIKYEQNLKVCPHCGFHARITAAERVEYMCDGGSFEERYGNLETVNPIEFEGYLERIERGKRATGLNEAVLTGCGEIEGIRCALGAMDHRFIMASVGSVAGEKLTRLFEDAAADRLPVIIFTASGGMRMQEGIISLMQMAKVSAAIGRHSAAGLFYITVICDPTTGGVTASFASLGDIIVAEPGATIGFAGRRVIEGTIGKKLPEEFQTSEFLLEHGFIDLISPRAELKATLAKLLRMNERREK